MLAVLMVHLAMSSFLILLPFRNGASRCFYRHHVIYQLIISSLGSSLFVGVVTPTYGVFRNHMHLGLSFLISEGAASFREYYPSYLASSRADR